MLKLLCKSLSIAALCVLVLTAAVSLAQEAAPPAGGAETPGERNSYSAIFEEFGKRYEVQQTRLDRLAKQEKSTPEERQAIFAEIKQIDDEYVAALSRYIEKNPNAADLEPARYEVVLTLSRQEEKLDLAVKSADSYIELHAGSDRIKDIKFARAQCLARIASREDDALKALDAFIAEFGTSDEADFARTMRIRMLLFIDRTEDAQASLTALLKLDKVRKNPEAKGFIEDQLDDLDWIGRELPKFALSTIDNKAIGNDDFTGKPMLVFFWDSNSGVCLEELGFVKAAYDKYHALGFAVLGISVNESKPALEQWLKRNASGFDNAWESRNAEGTLAKRLDVSAIPFNVLVDSKGKIYRYDVRSDELMRYAARMIERGK